MRLVRLEEMFDMSQGIVTSRLKDGGGKPVKVVQTRNLAGLEVEDDVDTLELNLPRKSGRLKKGDILVHLKTLPLRASVATQRDVGSIAGTNIAILTRPEDLNDPEEQFDPYYLAGMLRTRYMNRVLTSRLGGESVSSLSLRTLRTLPVPLPPPEVQTAMARAFRNLEKYARLTEDLVEARSEQLEIALDSYFRHP